MPFAIKVILVLLSVLILEVYFVKKVIGSINIIFPSVSKKKIKIGKWIVLTLINIYPVIAIAAWSYIFITKFGYFVPPENFFLIILFFIRFG